MSDTNETIADIISEKRRRADEIERDVAEKMKRGEMTSDQFARELVADIRREADRLEAAYKREIDEPKKQVANLQQQLPKPDPNWRDICAKCFKNGATEPPDCEYYTEDGCMSPIPDQHPLIQVGDCAKLREALVSIKAGILKRRSENVWYITDSDILEKIDAALAAPPRNCDAMDWRTAWKIWREKFHPETPVGYSAVVKGTEAFMDWFTAPATEKEGGAK